MSKAELEEEQAIAKNYDNTVELLEYGYYKTKHALATLRLSKCETLKEYNDKYSYYKDLLRRIADELNFYKRQILWLDLKDSADYYNVTSDTVGAKELKVNKQIDSIRNQIRNMKKY